MRIFRWLAFSALLMTSVSGANTQDFDKGAAALEAGDFKAALKEFLPLAEGGDVTAQFIIGRMYYEGLGVIQNYVEALKWYRLAAGQGDAMVQGNIGVMYYEGEGVKQNNEIAHMWFNIASSNGEEKSASIRDLIAAKMTGEEIAKAQALAKECISSGYKNCGD